MTQKLKHKVVAEVKMILKAGKASPAYPVGPTLGGYGINLGAVVREYNECTAHLVGMQVPMLITIYGDRSFSMQIMQPTTASLLRQAAGLAKGGSTPGRAGAGQITVAQLRAIAERKLEELNTADLTAAMQTVAGTARSMGLSIVGALPDTAFEHVPEGAVVEA